MTELITWVPRTNNIIILIDVMLRSPPPPSLSSIEAQIIHMQWKVLKMVRIMGKEVWKKKNISNFTKKYGFYEYLRAKITSSASAKMNSKMDKRRISLVLYIYNWYYSTIDVTVLPHNIYIYVRSVSGMRQQQAHVWYVPNL